MNATGGPQRIGLGSGSSDQGNVFVALTPGNLKFGGTVSTSSDMNFTANPASSGDVTVTFPAGNPLAGVYTLLTGGLTATPKALSVYAPNFPGDVTFTLADTGYVNNPMTVAGNNLMNTVPELSVAFTQAAETYGLIFDAVTGGFYLDVGGDGNPAYGTPYNPPANMWNWDGTTLTLTDFTWTTTAPIALTIVDSGAGFGSGDATIALSGTSTFTSASTDGSAGIHANVGALTIEGPGILNASAGDAAMQSVGLMAEGGLTVDGGVVNATAGEAAISCGIVAMGGMTVSGGTVTASGGTSINSYSYGVYSLSQPLTFNSGTVTLSGYGGAMATYDSANTVPTTDFSGPVINAASYMYWTSPGGVGTAGSYSYSDTDLYVKLTTATIDSAAVTVTAPVSGATPVTTAAGTGDFTVGAVTWSPAAASAFAAGTVYTASVTLTADAGYVFVSGFTATINGNAAAVIPNTDGTVTLTYQFPTTGAVQTYALNVTAGTGGTASGSGSYAAGTAVSISAAANAYYSFNTWTSSNGGTFVNANNASTTFTMPANATTVTANFTYTGSGSGGGSPYYTSNPTPSPTPPPTAGGGNTVTTPAGQDPVKNPDGSTTLPGGGTITTPGGTTITAPPGTVINKSGNVITLPNGNAGADVSQGGKDTSVDPGMTITITDGSVPLGGFTVGWQNPFGDVHPSDWFYNDVEYAYTHGLMTGTSGDPMLFSPQIDLTRGMIVEILYHAAGNPDVSGFSNPFSDATNGVWYTAAVKWAAANGIVAGIGNGKYGPDANVTREQLAEILHRYAVYKGKGPVGAWMAYLSFTDSGSISDWAFQGIMYCYINKIICGYPNGSVQPQSTAARAEAAAMIHRFLEITKD